jgi:hypothetical protein
LARVFPDGRTVHVPTDGVPLKGYELARADIEKRDNGDEALTRTKPSLFAALFKGKSNSDDEDEGVTAAIEENPAPAKLTTVAARSTEAVPVPRAKPAIAAAFQLASADAQVVQTARQPAQTVEAKPQTPADIINARGFWGDIAATPKQATPAQLAAIGARHALTAVDPQSTASASALEALAYAPAASSPVDRANVVAASAPVPRSVHPSSASRNAAPATGIDTVVAKGAQGQGSVIATSARLAAAPGNSIWMRVMMLAPSASSSMNATVLGDADMTMMRVYFVKPPVAIAMAFSDDPQMGMVTDHFSGSATAKLTTQSFVMQTASLR